MLRDRVRSHIRIVRAVFDVDAYVVDLVLRIHGPNDFDHVVVDGSPAVYFSFVDFEVGVRLVPGGLDECHVVCV